ncbi:hypothetical protein ABZ801_01225 [Actinomadura sp. NPDC047616]|uniref:hypothetical protein n=1 Tax=Actinomadura sp. NPDC047616 TaxID=3155914 RepID=UPI0033D388EB
MPTDAPVPHHLATVTLPTLATLICSYRDDDLVDVTDTVATLNRAELQALALVLVQMVPADAQLPALHEAADLLNRTHPLTTPISPERAAHNRAELAEALGLLEPSDDDTAMCTRCEQRKPHDHFYRDRRTPTGRSYRCKRCDDELRTLNRLRVAEDRAA